jgi:hypothetical protein
MKKIVHDNAPCDECRIDETDIEMQIAPINSDTVCYKKI